MTTTKKLILAGVAAAGMTAALPAAAQSVAAVDPVGAILSAKAISGALVTVNTTYKTQIDQLQARQTAISAQLKQIAAPLDTNKDGAVSQEEANAAQRANSPVLKQLQDAQQRAENELNTLQAPMVRARAYAIEQVLMRYNDALTAVATAKKLSLIVPGSPGGYVAPGADVTLDVKNQLDALLPSVSVAPPASWSPSEQDLQLLQQLEQAIRAQAAQQAQTAPAATTPAPAPARPGGKPQPQGR